MCACGRAPTPRKAVDAREVGACLRDVAFRARRAFSPLARLCPDAVPQLLALAARRAQATHERGQRRADRRRRRVRYDCELQSCLQTPARRLAATLALGCRGEPRAVKSPRLFL